MSHTNAAALRTTYWVFWIGSKLARSACGTKRNTRAAARCEIAGVASTPAAVRTPAPATDFRNALRSISARPGKRPGRHVTGLGAAAVALRLTRADRRPPIGAVTRPWRRPRRTAAAP